MLKRKIKYTDFNGEEREETFMFNLTNAEITELGVGLVGGGSLDEYIERLSEEKDPKKIIQMFKELICKAYGVKSEDGRRFMKSEEILKEFTETNAYSELFMELANDARKAAEFFDGIIPEMSAEQKEQVDAYRAKFDLPA